MGRTIRRALALLALLAAALAPQREAIRAAPAPAVPSAATRGPMPASGMITLRLSADTIRAGDALTAYVDYDRVTEFQTTLLFTPSDRLAFEPATPMPCDGRTDPNGCRVFRMRALSAGPLEISAMADGMRGTDGCSTCRVSEVVHSAPVARAVELPRALYFPLLNGAGGPAAGKIVFSSYRDGAGIFESDIYAINPDGTDVRRLTNGPGRNHAPDLSPDGRQIVFAADPDPTDPASSSNLYLMNSDGTERRVLIATPEDESDPAWSPDGRRIAFVAKSDIYLIDADGANLQRLTEHPGYDLTPAWSPDGRQIVFTSDKEGVTPHPGLPPTLSIWVIDDDGANLRRLTSNPDHFDWNPSWSPDGRHIAFMSYGKSHGVLYRIRPDGSGQTQVTGVVSVGRGLDWSPDSRRLAFTFSMHQQRSAIYTIGIDGTGLRPLTDHAMRDEVGSWGR